MGSDINVATGRFFDFNDAQAIGRRLSHGAGDNSPPDLNTRRTSQFLKEDYKIESSPSGSVIIESNAQWKSAISSPFDTNAIKSPFSTSSASTPLNIFSPRKISNSIFSRDIGPIAARKFSNVDSSSFRGIKLKLQSKICAPKLVLNNEDILGLVIVFFFF